MYQNMCSLEQFQLAIDNFNGQSGSDSGSGSGSGSSSGSGISSNFFFSGDDIYEVFIYVIQKFPFKGQFSGP